MGGKFGVLVVGLAIALLCISIASAKEVPQKQLDKIKEIYEKMTKIHEKHINILKKSIATVKSNTVYVYVTEEHYLGGWGVSHYLYIDVDPYTFLDNITITIQLPQGVEPEYTYGTVPDSFEFDKSTGVLTVRYEDVEDWIWTSIELKGLSMSSPFVSTPKVVVNPSYCAPYEQAVINVTMTGVTLNDVYDWCDADLEVEDVKSVSIISTTPPANDTYVYNDTSPIDDDYWSYAWAWWSFYDVSSIPTLTMLTSVQNDVNEVEIDWWCGASKDTLSNVQLLGVSTEPNVTTYIYPRTWVSYYGTIRLDPVNATIPHGILYGNVIDASGQPIDGVYVDIHDYYYNVLVEKITDENGNFVAMLPPGDYDIYCYYYSNGTNSWVYTTATVYINQTTNVTITLYKVPPVEVSIEKVDDNLAGDNLIVYNVTVTNVGTSTVDVSLSGDSDIWNNTDWIYGLSWSFSDYYFTLQPGESKTVTAYATFQGDEIPPYGKYGTGIWCDIYGDNVNGWIYITTTLEVGYFDVNVKADKESYSPGDTIALNVSLKSNGGQYPADIKLIVEYGDYSKVLKEVLVRYPKDYTVTKTIYITIPNFVPSGYYVFKVVIESADGSLLLGKDGDCIAISGVTAAKGLPNFNVKGFSFK